MYLLPYKIICNYLWLPTEIHLDYTRFIFVPSQQMIAGLDEILFLVIYKPGLSI